MLILSFNLKAARMGFFSRDEFVQGMKRLKITNIEDLKKFLTNAQRGYDKLDAESFRKIYVYAFKYSIEKDGQKAIDVDTAVHTLELVMKDRPHVQNFVR